jgi:glycosyltransferase involved in cell wall biosynthesis
LARFRFSQVFIEWHLKKKTMTDFKKICFLLPYHFSDQMGGAEYQVSLILEALCKMSRYDIYYLCSRSAPDFVAKDYHIVNIGKNSGINRFGFYFDAYRLYSALKKIRPQIIYQRVGCAYTGIAAMYAKKFGAKLVWHISHDNDVETAPGPDIKRRLIDSLERFFLNFGIRNADIIVGQTNHQSYLLEKHFRRKCDVIIPNGHPFPTQTSKKSQKIQVLWVSNLKPNKQPDVFVRLTREVGNAGNVTFVMMGHPHGSAKWFGALMEQIQDTQKLQYLGGVSQDEVNRRLNEGHIFVNTSRHEGFPNTFIQAWMRRVPVVSLTVDPDNILTRERIGFRSGTFKRLCSDVRVLIENKALREEMGIRARRFARDNHSVEKMFEKVMVLFE